MTLVLHMGYPQLFGLSPLAAPLLDEPWLLVAASLLVGSLLTVLVGQFTYDRVGLADTLVLAVSVAFLPTVVTFAFAVRVGIVTGFGPTVSVESFGHFVVGMFFVLLYTGFGAMLAGFIFTLVFVGSGIGAVLTVVLVRKFVDS